MGGARRRRRARGGCACHERFDASNCGELRRRSGPSHGVFAAHIALPLHLVSEHRCCPFFIEEIEVLKAVVVPRLTATKSRVDVDTLGAPWPAR
jgi:hypothetical protein